MAQAVECVPSMKPWVQTPVWQKKKKKKRKKRTTDK
jgi:hypothetical protein